MTNIQSWISCSVYSQALSFPLLVPAWFLTLRWFSSTYIVHRRWLSTAGHLITAGRFRNDHLPHISDGRWLTTGTIDVHRGMTVHTYITEIPVPHRLTMDISGHQIVMDPLKPCSSMTMLSWSCSWSIVDKKYRYVLPGYILQIGNVWIWTSDGTLHM